MTLVQNLLALYAGIIVINAGLSAALWGKNRDRLHRALFFVWATTLVSFVLQGLLTQNALALTLGFASAFVVNLSLAWLVAEAVDTVVRWRPFAVVLAASVVVSVAQYVMGRGFTAVALPVCFAVALPLFTTALRVARTRWAKLTISGRVLLASCFAFCLHNLDFAFLRDRPEAAPLGFTIAIFIIFVLSVTAPAVVLELATRRQARALTEMEAARRIQSRLLPRDAALPGLDLVCHMRTADSVGGDYFDIHTLGEDSWFLVGDVTGHGLGAGLVMLMAQSIVGSILEARPKITPRELNFLANRVLCANLARLDEQRHMTIVSLRRLGESNRFLVSGSHDDIYVLRARSGEVEVVGVSHFPFGIGFLPELALDHVREDVLTLEAGDVLFIGTDGITEAARGGDHLKGVFGEARLLSLLKDHIGRPLPEIKEKLLAHLEAFTGGVFHDDVAFIMLRATDAGR